MPMQSRQSLTMFFNRKHGEGNRLHSQNNYVLVLEGKVKPQIYLLSIKLSYRIVLSQQIHVSYKGFQNNNSPHLETATERIQFRLKSLVFARKLLLPIFMTWSDPSRAYKQPFQTTLQPPMALAFISCPQKH